MSYRIEVKVITENDRITFEQKCSELETELQESDVYEYYPQYSVAVISDPFLQYTAIFRIYYEVLENSVALGYGGAD